MESPSLEFCDIINVFETVGYFAFITSLKSPNVISVLGLKAIFKAISIAEALG